VSRYLPVFPLGAVLFPAQALPLHVFEDRYRQLMELLTAGGSSGEMGVVLIERGSEVGGGDVRVGTGTVAHLIEAERLPDGRWAAIFAGSHVFRVERWLPDDPFPQAMVDELAEEEWDGRDGDVLSMAEAVVREALNLAAELDGTGGTWALTLSSDPVRAAWELCARAPLGPFDRQRLLEAPTRHDRLSLLAELAGDAARLLAFRLRGG
jgi:Lon protease-like protein